MEKKIKKENWQDELNLKKKNNLYGMKGITLVALVITIVILIILATISIQAAFGDNGLIEQAKRTKDMAENSIAKENDDLNKLEQEYANMMAEDGKIPPPEIEDEFDKTNGVNKPKLQEGMIPVYYDEGTKTWKKADENNKDKQWYDYENKKWANIVTVADENGNLREAAVGTKIPMDKITTFFVWIPRYAYSITSGYKQGNGATGSIDVTFLKGNTNTGADGTSYPTDYDESNVKAGDATPKIVHPGFTLGNSELTGIWVAKFEASGTTADGTAVGNAADGTGKYNPVKPDKTTYVKIVPNKISWRDTTIGEAEYRSMQMSSNTNKYGWTNGVNSHLIKNNEWGAVAYLCYSKYGNVPKTNGAGTYNSTEIYIYNLYTGAGPKSASDEGKYENFEEGTNGYNTTLGVLASTTGNVYGVYDMAGGAWDRVAAYLDNGNVNLNDYGKSTSDSGVKYFENGTLKQEYSSLWNTYQVSDEEKSNKIQVEGVGTVTQDELWNWDKKGQEYNEARLRLTKANFDNMAKYKGIGVNETSTSFSYYAPCGTDTVYKPRGWFQTVKNTETDQTEEHARTWNSDYTRIGHASIPFVVCGGHYGDGSGAGVLVTSITDGDASHYYGFRPVLAF